MNEKSELKPNDGAATKPDEPVAPPLIGNGPPPASVPEKKSWAHCLPLCPHCGEPMKRDGKDWKCAVVEENGKAIRGCGQTDTNGKWRVEFYPRVPTFNKKGKTRYNQLTLETWPNKEEAEARVLQLNNHFNNVVVVPKQPTWLPPEQCRAGERFFEKYSIEQLEFCKELLATLATSKVKTPEELITFLRKYNEFAVPCTLAGMLKHCNDSKWRGDLVPKLDFVESVQKVLKHNMGRFGGKKPISEAQINKSKSQNGYIMAYFQPNYPEPTYPDAVFTDAEIIRFCTYSYDTPREGFETEIEKWKAACGKAKEDGLPEPPKPVEEPVYKLVEDGVNEYGITKWKKVPGTLEYQRPWPRTVANSFIIACRALKNAMARPTLCGEPAGWVAPPGPDIKPIAATKDEQALEAIARAKERRVLTPVERQRIYDASLVVDGGRGAASVLWQGHGGGRRSDVERYVQENFVNGRIVAQRWQTKNGSCKDEQAMLNFFVMADYLMRRGLWTEENFKNGFNAVTRARILARAGFWEECWDMMISVEDMRACEDFGYQPFDNEDLLDLEVLVDMLWKHTTPRAAFLWDGFSESEKETLLKYHPSDKGQKEVRDVIRQRLNAIMDGPLFDPNAICEGVSLSRRAADLLKRRPTGPNLQYLNRLILENLFQGLLANRQNYPPNGLRRTGMCAFQHAFEDENATIAYFSTGETSWKKNYKAMMGKPSARFHWMFLYSCMGTSYSEEDLRKFLPEGHKLDDTQAPVMVEVQKKNEILAKEHQEEAPPATSRHPNGADHRRKYTKEEKDNWVEKYKQEQAQTKISQHAFADKYGLCFGVFHRWLEIAGLTRKVRTPEEIAKLIADFKKSGMTQQKFAGSVGVPFGTFHTYLVEAGETETYVKHTPKQTAEYLRQFESSGMSKPDFAKSIGVDVTTLRKWLKKAKAEAEPGTDGKAEELSDLLPGRKFSDERVAEILEEYGESESTQEEFAKSRGIGVKTLSIWLKAAGKTIMRRTREEIAAHICKFRESGMTRFAFAQSIGVCSGTLSRWLKDDQTGQSQ